MADTNKIRYGFKNVYYAVLTETSGTVTYGKPKAWKGAKSLALDPEGDTNIFYADDTAYYSDATNNGYSGSIEMAYVSDDVKKDIFNYVETSKGTLAEDANKPNNPVCLLAEFQGDQNAVRYCFFKIVFSRPSFEANTKEDTLEPDTTSIDITCLPVTDAGGTHAWLKESYDPSNAAYATLFTTAPTLPTEKTGG